jgi:hypothetical protein
MPNLMNGVVLAVSGSLNILTSFCAPEGPSVALTASDDAAKLPCLVARSCTFAVVVSQSLLPSETTKRMTRHEDEASAMAVS